MTSQAAAIFDFPNFQILFKFEIIQYFKMMRKQHFLIETHKN